MTAGSRSGAGGGIFWGRLRSFMSRFCGRRACRGCEWLLGPRRRRSLRRRGLAYRGGWGLRRPGDAQLAIVDLGMRLAVQHHAHALLDELAGAAAGLLAGRRQVGLGCDVEVEVDLRLPAACLHHGLNAGELRDRAKLLLQPLDDLVRADAHVAAADLLDLDAAGLRRRDLEDQDDGAQQRQDEAAEGDDQLRSSAVVVVQVAGQVAQAVDALIGRAPGQEDDEEDDKDPEQCYADDEDAGRLVHRIPSRGRLRTQSGPSWRRRSKPSYRLRGGRQRTVLSLMKEGWRAARPAR